ncbi:hypothetical protein AN396_05240 [Candidatus Epulonipiscium fishelsonii]|uniref:Uncharacterized protein n=1 Tax=Candidatus Epulonipiscium fishelsonii TaxID=77094 RepID=A0ACC8XD30_9FIRM|nr:hypothetical protein AN396_05240 [Epulopiscium sp. SCG-B11WGA-EpuloA1]
MQIENINNIRVVEEELADFLVMATELKTKIKSSANKTGNDVSTNYILVSNGKNPITNETISVAYSKAISVASSIIRYAGEDKYSYEEIIEATENLNTLYYKIKDNPRGNKEATEKAKQALKEEIDQARSLLESHVASGKQKQAFEEVILKAERAYKNRYASLNGTYYIEHTNGEVEEIYNNNEKYEKIGYTNGTGIRGELLQASEIFKTSAIIMEEVLVEEEIIQHEETIEEAAIQFIWD